MVSDLFDLKNYQIDQYIFFSSTVPVYNYCKYMLVRTCSDRAQRVSFYKDLRRCFMMHNNCKLVFNYYVNNQVIQISILKITSYVS